jgi:hypothetical protein
MESLADHRRSNLSPDIPPGLLTLRNLWYHDYILQNDMGIRTRQGSSFLSSVRQSSQRAWSTTELADLDKRGRQ